MTSDEKYRKVAAFIDQARRLVAFSGAGISTESGIPDFRSPGGVWSRYDPQDFLYQNFLASHEARLKYWRISEEFLGAILQAEPNAAHHALVELERLGKLDCVITQNVDGLHQRAGTSREKVIELHGTVHTVSCQECGARASRREISERIRGGVEVPYCDACCGPLKPDTISFGQAMPERETREALERSRACDLFFVIGSSLVVHPAARMPVEAAMNNAKLVIINLSETPHDHFTTVLLREPAGKAMQGILSAYRQILAG